MRNNLSKIKQESTGCSCVVLILMFVIANVILGSASVNYCAYAFLGKTFSPVIAFFIGLFVAEFTLPIALVLYICHHLFNLVFPLLK